MRRAERALRVASEALETLARRPDGRALRAAEQALSGLRAAADAYFHAPNLRDRGARAHALRLRPLLAAQLAQPDGLLALGADDVIRVRSAISDRLAEAALRLGERQRARKHALAALAAGAATAARRARLARAEGRPSPVGELKPLEVDQEGGAPGVGEGPLESAPGGGGQGPGE